MSEREAGERQAGADAVRREMPEPTVMEYRGLTLKRTDRLAEDGERLWMVEDLAQRSLNHHYFRRETIQAVADRFADLLAEMDERNRQANLLWDQEIAIITGFGIKPVDR